MEIERRCNIIAAVVVTARRLLVLYWASTGLHLFSSSYIMDYVRMFWALYRYVCNCFPQIIWWTICVCCVYWIYIFAIVFLRWNDYLVVFFLQLHSGQQTIDKDSVSLNSLLLVSSSFALLCTCRAMPTKHIQGDFTLFCPFQYQNERQH